jgi:hypothetical protein
VENFAEGVAAALELLRATLVFALLTNKHEHSEDPCFKKRKTIFCIIISMFSALKMPSERAGLCRAGQSTKGGPKLPFSLVKMEQAESARPRKAADVEADIHHESSSDEAAGTAPASTGKRCMWFCLYIYRQMADEMTEVMDLNYRVATKVRFAAAPALWLTMPASCWAFWIA